MRRRTFPDASDQDQDQDRTGGVDTLPREDSPDGTIAARWAAELDRSGRRRDRDALAQLRAQLAQARADLALARAEVGHLQRERDTARTEAAGWRRLHADALADCATITARREALIDSLEPALGAILLGASLRAWDEGWEAAHTATLVKRQNPHRRAAVEAAEDAEEATPQPAR